MSNRTTTILSVLLACCAPAAVAQAQRTVIYDNVTGTATVIEGEIAVPARAVVAAERTAAPTTAPSTQPASPEQQRVAVLLAVKYDRKPPAVLAALAPKTQPATRPTTLPADQATRLKADVESGNWPGVADLLKSLPPEDAKKVHANIVQQLAQDPQTVVMPDDVLDLAVAFPAEPTEEGITAVGRLLSVALRRNNSPQPLVARLEQGVGPFGGKEQKHRSNAAALLYAAHRILEGGPFLAPLDAAIEAKDTATVDLHARHQQALATAAAGRGDSAGYAALMRKAWDLTQTVLREAKHDARERDLAFQRSLQLLQTLPKELGDSFLRDSFKSRPQDGHKLLTHLATQIAEQAPQPGRPRGGGGGGFQSRLQPIQLQRRLVEQLLAALSGDDLKAWRTPLNVMAMAWLNEAEWSKQRYQQRNPYQSSYSHYGGPYMYEEQMMMQEQRQNPNEPQPIPPQQLTESAPTEAWIGLLDPTLAPRIKGGLAEMRMKADEVDDVLPVVESIAAEHPRLAHSLATEMLRTWARVKNPNQNRYSNYDPYGYSYNPYGSPQGISMTRLAQARNLLELSQTLQRLKRLPIDPVDESTVVAAFAAAHSAAEVYRLDDVELVFGKVEVMSDKTLANFVQTMRQRLARDWRQPQVQQQAKTKRNDKDVDAEVVRGYDTLLRMLDRRSASTDWRAHGARGSVLYDYAEFEYGKKVPLAVYTKKRDAAFAAFRKSLEVYLAKLATLEESEQTAQPWQQYFNAALGSSDLQYLTRQDEPDKDHIDRIRDSLFALPENVRERHVSQFGKGLTDNLGSIPAELKARYLRVGVRIMGDHPSAEEARSTVQYYKDLTTEAELHVRLDAKDNDTTVGHTRPFGAFISLRHSNALGRESGGFQRYLMNPASSRNYYYYGGPTPKNHRDAFEKKIREALVEHFDIVSITFHDEKIEPRGFGRPEWRETPLAYVLLKAKDAKTDRIPPIQLDLEFADKRGPVVLPVESNLLLVDARPADVAARPLTNLAVTQILDGRDAAKGKLNLEVKATGSGLVPDLTELLDPNVPGLKLDKTDGQPLVITKLDTESDSLAPVTERTWMINYSIAEDAPADLAFKFPAVKTPGGAAMTYKRYADADLEDVSERVALAGLRLRKAPWWKWPAIVGGALVAGAIATLIVVRMRRTGQTSAAPAYAMPRVVNPFTVVDLLSRIHSDDAIGLTPQLREQLVADIRAIERSHFADGNGNGNGHDAPAPAEVARRWLSRATS